MTEIFYVTIVFLLFALSHSLLVSNTFKNLTVSLLGEKTTACLYRFLFTLISILTVVVAIFLLREVKDVKILHIKGILGIICHAVQTAGIFIIAISFRHIGILEFLGIRQVMACLRGAPPNGDIEGLRLNRFITTGIYKYVRHPLYLGGILIAAFNPHITRTALTITILSILYFVIGAFIEEKRLVEKFGRQYMDYMIRVPRFFPSFRR